MLADASASLLICLSIYLSMYFPDDDRISAWLRRCIVRKEQAFDHNLLAFVRDNN
jgi:hypothetical protein